MTALDHDALLRRDDLRLLLCVGTGGVGKTTMSAALAVRAAQLGRRVVVVTIDPARRLAQAMGLDGLAHDPVPVPLPDSTDPGRGPAGSLDAMMLDVRDAFDRALTAQVDAAEADRIRSNPFYRALAEAFSGTQEYVAMEKIGELHRRGAATGEWDLIVVDTPPSASALDFLDGPNRLESLARNPLLRVVLGLPRGPLGFLDAGAALATRALDAILGGRLFGDLRTFLRVFERAVLAFESHATQTRQLLASDAAGFLVIAAARPGPAAEASALIERLRRDALPVRGVVVNQTSDVAGVVDEVALRAAAASATPEQAVIIEGYRERLARVATERPLIEKLGGFGLPLATIGRRPEPVSDLRSLVALLGGFDQ
ncbi:ArsA family ATPase [Micropruina sonneratiae]|uniref:ArsA family ATPase n=1 Tax=Micropruina sonneratiae TaxID=2986940 RepID=UPI002227CDCB|nr:ArsA-related P-loop ATPase [Micropruina sp. KQZ13P-5]MCW3156463.1 AAA family ATPase [Micropruina sp. KQZ13P-5]